MQFETTSIHAGQERDALTGALTPPIFQTSTFAQDRPGEPGDFGYARTANPTRRALETTLARLEGGADAVAYASGLAAVTGVLDLLSTGDHVITCRDLYGGSYRAFTKVYSRLGIEFSFVDTKDPAAVENALRETTRLLWLETPSNPLLNVTDLESCTAIARRVGALVAVDNTFATPYLQRPLEHGADLVVHSTTKYLNGHGDVIGGAVIARTPELRERLHFAQNATGGVPGPFDCFLVARGLKTLALRMERHVESAARIALFLDEHPAVERVYYPGLPSHPGHEIAARQMDGFGGIVSFDLAAGPEAARRFVTHTRLFTLAESLGSVHSLACHPATMTHASVEPPVRAEAGISDALVRLSVGCENGDDLLADLERALVIL